MRAFRRRAGERGAVAVIVALLLAVLLAFLAIELNVGHATTMRRELQNAIDAAALASARELNGRSSGLGTSRQMASSYSASHATDDGQPVALDTDADVTFGSWDFTTSTFRATSGSTAGELLATNAVWVRAGREARRGNALPVWLAAVLGVGGSLDVRAEAIAVSSGPCQRSCIVPLAFASCGLVDGAGALRCNQTLVFRNSTVDTAGLTGLADVASTSVVGGLLAGVAAGQACPDVHAGDQISIQNGNNFNPLYPGFRDLVGRTVSAAVVEPVGCPSNPTFNQGYPVLGFASFRIDYVGNTGRDPKCPDAMGPCIQVTLQCDQVVNEPATGCGFFGLRTLTSRLVR
jgi:Flp pilus assembly protein TadG